MTFYKNLGYVLVLVLLSACTLRQDDITPATVDDIGYTEGSQGIGQGVDGGVEYGTVENNRIGSQEDLIAEVGDRVFFEFNSAKLSPISKQTLDRQAEWLKTNGGVTVTIEGHCDERGTREYNIALGDKRAEAVKTYFIEKNITVDRIKTISYGKEHPEYLGSNEAAWSKNRRSITVID